jgi:NTP pyrophosphatase (non-canonical NTP hydrolase)
MTIQEFQRLIERIYFDRDARRGVDRSFVWFVEEVGELAKEIRREPQDADRLREEFADVFAWLSTLASLLNVNLTSAAQIYSNGCPKCESIPCICSEEV